jgi:hypothetical protein
VKLQLSAISDQVCEASNSPDGADSLAGYPVVELAAIEIPEGKIRDIFAAINQAKDVAGKIDFSKIKNLFAWWQANGDSIIKTIADVIGLFSMFASPAPSPAPVAPPAPPPPTY